MNTAQSRILVSGLSLIAGLFSCATQRVAIDPGVASITHLDPLPDTGQGRTTGEMAETPPPEPGAAPEESKYGTVATLTGVFGLRSFEDPVWESVEDQFVGGIEGAYQLTRTGIGLLGIELGFHFSDERTSTTLNGNPATKQGISYELSLGPRVWHNLDDAPFSFWAGAGLSAIDADIRVTQGATVVRERDLSGGVYWKLGAAWRIDEELHLGLEYRGLGGSDVRLGTIDADADYHQVALVLGYGAFE